MSEIPADLEARVRVLEDKEDITQLLKRYCRALDRLDGELLKSVFFEDARLDYGPGLFRGAPEEFVPFALEFQGAMEHTRHLIDNALIELDSDRAFCESYVTALHEYQRGGQALDLRVDGRFIDCLERRNGEWRIVERTELIDMAHERTATPGWFDQSPELNRGRHGSDDLLYEFYRRWETN